MKFTKTNIVRIAQAVLGLVALLLLFAPALSVTVLGQEVTYSGFQAWLGAELGKLGSNSISNDLTFGGVLALILIVAAVALPLVSLFVKKDVVKFLNYITLGVALVAAIFLFCGTTGLMCSFDASGFGLGWGAIVGAILLIVEAAGSAVIQFVIKED